MSLSDIAALARSEPALESIAGRKSSLIAVPEAARPLILSALRHSTTRTPIVVAVPAHMSE